MANLPDLVQRLLRMCDHQKRLSFPYYPSFGSIHGLQIKWCCSQNDLYTFGRLFWNSVRWAYMGLFLKILNRLHIHCMVQSIYKLKINRWPDINVALFATVTEVCCYLHSCKKCYISREYGPISLQYDKISHHFFMYFFILLTTNFPPVAKFPRNEITRFHTPGMVI